MLIETPGGAARGSFRGLGGEGEERMQIEAMERPIKWRRWGAEGAVKPREGRGYADFGRGEKRRGGRWERPVAASRGSAGGRCPRGAAVGPYCGGEGAREASGAVLSGSVLCPCGVCERGGVGRCGSGVRGIASRPFG